MPSVRILSNSACRDTMYGVSETIAETIAVTIEKSIAESHQKSAISKKS